MCQTCCTPAAKYSLSFSLMSNALSVGLMTSTANSGTTGQALTRGIGRFCGHRANETNATSGLRSLPLPGMANIVSMTPQPRLLVRQNGSSRPCRIDAIRFSISPMGFSTRMPLTTSNDPSPSAYGSGRAGGAGGVRGAVGVAGVGKVVAFTGYPPCGLARQYPALAACGVATPLRLGSGGQSFQLFACRQK